MSIIAAIATGQSPGGVGMIRVSGEGCTELADRVFIRADSERLSTSAGYRAHYGKVIDGKGWSDEAVAIVYRAPKSYTGEDVVELCCHGGAAATRLTLKACIDAGASPAGAGEFTRRAFENGKLSLAQAEAVMTIVSAEGRQAAIAARAAHSGRLSRRIAQTADILTELSAKLAAWCDYPDEEEVPEVTIDELLVGLDRTKSLLQTLKEEGTAGRMLREGIDTVICGKPNVGKSTLMNLLAGCERSIVTDLPGTTRDVVEEHITLGGCTLRISDTAGLRETEDTIERIGVERAIKRVEDCALVLAVFDGSKALDDDDRMMMNSLSGKPCIAVINKTDKEQRIDTEYIQKKIQQAVYISAANGEGIDKLADAIMRVTQLEKLDPSAGILISDRQIDCVSRALSACGVAYAAVKSGVTFDAVNVLIQDAIAPLLELTGERVTDRVVDSVFERFCVGK